VVKALRPQEQKGGLTPSSVMQDIQSIDKQMFDLENSIEYQVATPEQKAQSIDALRGRMDAQMSLLRQKDPSAYQTMAEQTGYTPKPAPPEAEDDLFSLSPEDQKVAVNAFYTKYGYIPKAR
jgi:hypothetical protein